MSIKKLAGEPTKTLSVRLPASVIDAFVARTKAKCHNQAALWRLFIQKYMEGVMDG